MAINAFNPTGATIVVVGAATAPTGLQAVGLPAANQFRLQNNGSVTAFVAFGVDAATAQSNAVIPTGAGASAKNAFPLPAGAIEVITAGLDSFFSAITASSTANIYITPGVGL